MAAISTFLWSFVGMTNSFMIMRSNRKNIGYFVFDITFCYYIFQMAE